MDRAWNAHDLARVLSHYEETSDGIARIVNPGEPSGFWRQNQVGAYWENACDSSRSRFDLLGIFVGPAPPIHYRNQTGGLRGGLEIARLGRVVEQRTLR